MLKIRHSSEDRKSAATISKYARRGKWRKLEKFLKEEKVHPDSVLKSETGERGLHLAAKSGQSDSLRILLKLGADPRIKDKQHNYPLHYGIKYCLKNYSHSAVVDLVDVLVPLCRDLLEDENLKGTSCRTLLRGLKMKREIEERIVTESSSSTDESDQLASSPIQRSDFSDRLAEEANDEYFENLGKWDQFGTEEISDETFNDWADRIYAEFQRKRFQQTVTTTKPRKHEQDQKSFGPKKPKLKLNLKQVVKEDIYLNKCKKLFETKEEIRLKDLPFAQDSSADKIVEAILFPEGLEKGPVDKNRLRDALRRWHPDKFQHWSQGRVKSEEEKSEILKIVTHVSQVLLNYGK